MCMQQNIFFGDWIVCILETAPRMRRVGKRKKELIRDENERKKSERKRN